MVPSILSVEGKRIVLPAFFQRGRDTPDKTRQTLATAHRIGPTRRRRFLNGMAVGVSTFKAAPRTEPTSVQDKRYAQMPDFVFGASRFSEKAK
jgi:hypothetical protein